TEEQLPGRARRWPVRRDHPAERPPPGAALPAAGRSRQGPVGPDPWRGERDARGRPQPGLGRWAGPNVPGYHWHFLSDDRTVGGHVLDCRVREGRVQYAVCRDWLIK